MAVKPRATKPALSLWLIDHRKKLGMKPADVARAVGVSEDTVRGWEAGRGIGPASRLGLTELFGESAPDGGGDYATADLAAAISALVGALDRDREERMALTRAIAALAQSLARRPEGAESPAPLAPRAKAG